MNEILVLEAAQAFRSGIEATQGAGILVLQNFPHGSCGDTSDLLAEYFMSLGFGDWTYVSGKSGSRHHAWLQQDSLIVDITADQFGATPVVVSYDAHSYEQFTERRTRKAGIEDSGAMRHYRQNLHYSFNTILQAIRKAKQL